MEDATEVQFEEEPTSALPPELPGYRLESLLGRGSFGEVWSGTQERTGLKVAVKLLHGAAGPSFANEVARLRELVEHPHIVTLLDADLKHQPAYFVMPWLRQGSLADVASPLLEQVAPRRWNGTGGWFREIALALQFTHEKGFLHCDLKPSNVLLDEQGHARLVDFGQSVGQQDREGALGTLGCMAPEQATLAAPSVRWDIYALGATIHFMLTGDFPRLTSEGRTTLSGLSGRQRMQEYSRLLALQPEVGLRRRRPDLDADLVALVEACLALDPARRPASAAEIASDLDSRDRREPLLCRRPWSLGYRIGTLVRRPAVAVGLLGLVALLATGAVYSVRLDRSLQESRQLNSRLMSERGLVASRQGRFDEAQLWWAEALRLTPDDQGLRRLLAEYPFRLEKMFRTGADSGEFTVDGELVTEPSRVPKGEPTKPMRFGRDWSGPKEVGEARFPAIRPAWRGERDGQLWSADGKRGPHLPVKLGGKPELCFAVSRDGKQVATMDPMGRVQVWDPRTGAALSPVMLSHDWAEGMQFSPDGKLLAAAFMSHVQVWQLPEGRPVSASLTHPDRVVALRFSPDGRWLVTFCRDGYTRVFDVLAGLPRPELVATVSDRRWASFADDELTWSPRREGVPVPWSGPGFEALLLTREAFAPGHFAEVTGERTIAMDGHEFKLGANVNGVALSQDGRLWVGTGQEVGEYSATGELQGKATDVGLCFNLWTVAPDGSQLASAPFPADWGSEGEGVRGLPDLSGWPPLRLGSLRLPVDRASCLRFSPDGSLLAVGQLGGSGEVLSARTGEPVFRFPYRALDDSLVRCLAFSRDGRLLASAAANGLVRLWDTTTGRPASLDVELGEEVGVLLFAPDSRSLAVGTSSGKLYRVRLPEPLTGSPEEIARQSQRWTGAVLDPRAGDLRATTP